MSAAEQVRMTKVRQHFERPRIVEIERTVQEGIAGCGVKFPAGKEVAVAVGSRGIANLAAIVKAVVNEIRATEAKPFIIPAMGSHGGATAKGQANLLRSYGVTGEKMGCEVRSSMEVVNLPADGLGHSLFMDQYAFGSAGVVLINRIKPHTDFHGSFESGLVKMSVIGLGKERQAYEMHRFGVHGLRDLVPKAAKRIFATGRVLMGIGIVENAYDETALIEVIPAKEIFQREPELLQIAHKNMARLPVDELDLLIVDRMGKNISGAGMDTNIIGRIYIRGEEEPERPRIKSIVATRLTEESHGNATGIGLADVVTKRLVDQTDFDVTYKNIVTSGFLERGKLPVVARNDAEAVEIALRGSGQHDLEKARIVRIRDTLHLDQVYVSTTVLREIHGRPGIEETDQTCALFDSEGNLTAAFS